MVTLIKHDMGCRYARPQDGGHSDAARRLSDWFNLHRAAGVTKGTIAVSLADGSTDGVVYDNRADAVNHQHHNERWYCYVRLDAAPSMGVCEAESVMRWQRQTAELQLATRGEKHGGMEVIPRITQEGRERQIAAMRGQIDLPIAIGYGKE